MSSDRNNSAKTIGRRPALLRLEIKGADLGHGCMDGGWWPRSYDASEEFPPLIDALSERVGSIERIGYDMDAWYSVSRKLTHGDVVVRCEGFHTVFADTVSIISIAGARLILVVVPPQTSRDVAEAALHAAADATSTRNVRDLLAAAILPAGNVRPTGTAPAGRATTAIFAAQPR